MTTSSDGSTIANLSFLALVYDRGETIDERDSDLSRLALQNKGEIHFDRDQGGGLSELEQEPNDEKLVLQFKMNMVESIYRFNESKEFDPLIVAGFRDVTTEVVKTDGTPAGERRNKLVIRLTHRILDNLSQSKRLELT